MALKLCLLNCRSCGKTKCCDVLSFMCQECEYDIFNYSFKYFLLKNKKFLLSLSDIDFKVIIFMISFRSDYAYTSEDIYTFSKNIINNPFIDELRLRIII